MGIFVFIGCTYSLSVYDSLPVELVVSHKTVEALITGPVPVGSQCYRPEMLRLVPPLHHCEDEVKPCHLQLVDIEIVLSLLPVACAFDFLYYFILCQYS